MDKILLKNGAVFIDGKMLKRDLFIANGKIDAIREKIETTSDEKFIDCSACLILPGGIDPHVHMHLPTPAGFSADDFETGSRAAIAGGTTSFIDFVTPKCGQSLTEALILRREEAKGCACNVRFHVSPVEWTGTTDEEIIRCIEEEGITSFKVYMAYRSTIGLSDEDIFRVMRTVGRHGGIVAVHCELDEKVEMNRAVFLARGQTSPLFHPLSRPGRVEAEAVRKAIKLAERAECPLYIVHVSAHESLDFIEKSQSKGQPVYAETCPQYLLLDDNLYDQPFDRSCAYVMSPPLRKKEDNEALWQAIANGIIQTVGTDHCSFTLLQKKQGIDDFTKIPNGADGVEHRLSLLYHFGVLKNRISLQRFVEVTSENPAKIFGWFPQKGTIKEGSDADLVIWDPGAMHTISSKTHHQNCDLSIYEGMKVQGLPGYTIINGKIHCTSNSQE